MTPRKISIDLARLTMACILLIFYTAVKPGNAHADDDTIGSIEEKVDQLQAFEGFFNLYWNEDSGRLFLQIDDMDDEFIYQSSMSRGVGSNDLGLDRGQLGDTRLVEFQRSGPKILLIEQNTRYRANSSDEAEVQAVAHSFGRSVIWGFNLVAKTGDSVLVDATDFFLRDAHSLSTRLERAAQGSYKPDPSRSAIYLPRTKAFPDNTEIEAIVTYTGEQKLDSKGAVVSDTLASVVPDVTAVTVHLHHSLIRLPDDNYTPLPYDPRAGIIGAPGYEGGFQDYAVPIETSIKTNYGRRHRLEKKDPTAEVSEAVEPIIYYLDPGAPEPIRSALLEGASWWNEAFEAAGYKDAFQVRMLPADADPMDVRYNVIQWVHRSTRGWSYGSSVLDPRTGEILKGHVTLGSLRVRQDYLIAEGLLGPYENDEKSEAMLDMSLARIRQLSAHEVGHTLGFEHNFAASVNDRSSVMDYPFPLIRFDADGGLDLSEAYGTGIGEWDKRTVIYAYQDFPEGVDEEAGRQAILNETLQSGLLYVADADARDPGSAHPQGNLWDNGEDAIAELKHLLKVRDYALGRIAENSIQNGRPMAMIEEALVPIYLLHRFQIQAVGKLIGGWYFHYTLRGDGQPDQAPVDGKQQRAAIDALLQTLRPGLLLLPEDIINAIPPRPPGFARDRESFSRHTGTSFDPVSPAASAVRLTLDVILNRERAARMDVMSANDDSLPGFQSLLDALNNATWFAPRQAGMAAEIQRMTNSQALYAQMELASDTKASQQVRAAALQSVQSILAKLQKQNEKRLDTRWTAHYAQAMRDIRLWLENPTGFSPGLFTKVPPGSPIGN
jgi:hypothetical protein